MRKPLRIGYKTMVSPSIIFPRKYFLRKSEATRTKSPMMTGSSSPLVWNPITSHEQSYIFAESEASESFFHFPLSSQPQIGYDLASQKPSTAGSFPDLAVAKKLNHSASERHRRKKINSLYSSLRSLLPVADQKKKLSNPSTISRVLSYIPELQNQMEELMKKKEELLLSMAGQEYLVNNEQNKKRKSEAWSSNVLSGVSANKLNEREVLIQLCLDHIHKNQFSEILPVLEEDGLLLMNASSFESQTGKTFFNLHLQVESNYRWESEIVKEGLMQA